MTENSPILAVNWDRCSKPDSAGTPMPGTEIIISEPDASGMGEVLAKGPSVMLGYYDNPEATEETIVDGWLHTGDYGYFDDDGYLDICAVKGPISTPRFIYLILKYMKGKHLGEKEIEIFHGKNISVKFNREVNLQIDGENTSLKEATFELFPKGLTLRVPKIRKID